MIKNSNQSDSEERIVLEVRKAIEHRATWMYLLLKEAREKGLEPDVFARPAIRATGNIQGRLKREKLADPDSLVEFRKVFGTGTSQQVFEMEVVEADEEKYYLDFHYCPLVSAWEKLGATQEEIEELCDIAMDGDRGMAEQFPAFEFSLGDTIAQGKAACQIRFDRIDRSKP